MRTQTTTVVLVALACSISVGRLANAGIVAHYSFDNPADRYADITGNGWNGALGGSGTTFVAGVSGDAMRSTTGSKMNVTAGTTGQGNIAASLSSFTISFWASDSVNSWDNWAAFGNDSFFVQNTGSNTLFLYNPGATPGYTSGSLASTSAFGSALTHVAITADSTAGQVKLYIDSNLEDTEPWTVASTSNLGWFTVGGAFNTGIRNIAADIDDLQVYDSALNSGQIGYLFNNPGLSVIPEPSALVLSAFALLSLGLVGWRRRRRT